MIAHEILTTLLTTHYALQPQTIEKRQNPHLHTSEY
jgi:hypothetical protein